MATGSHVQAKAVTNGVVVNVDDALGAVAFYGLSLRATADAVVNVRVATSGGLILASHTITAAGAGIDTWYGPDGINCPGDLYCEIASGTVVGSLRYG